MALTLTEHIYTFLLYYLARNPYCYFILSPTTDMEMHFSQWSNSSRTTNWTLTMIRSQSEWLFINMTIISKTVDNFGINQSMLVYTVSIYG